MPNVVVSSETLTVIGPPEFVLVETDFGPKGDSGSQIFVGIGDPNEVAIGQTPSINDLYINASPDANYSFMYQYISSPSGNIWTKVLRINPAIYSNNVSAVFSAGSVAITIPVADIVTASGMTLTANNFNVQHSIEHSSLVASSISSVSYASNNLTINLKAASFNGSTWSNLATTVKVHLFISIVKAV